MAIGIQRIDHVQITVPKSTEQAARHFYSAVLGLTEIPKPEMLKKRGGVWYRGASIELHLSVEDAAFDNHASRRHVCFLVADLARAEQYLREAGVEIIPDQQPMAGWARFYVRDPGGNRLEIAQRV